MKSINLLLINAKISVRMLFRQVISWSIWQLEDFSNTCLSCWALVVSPKPFVHPGTGLLISFLLCMGEEEGKVPLIYIAIPSFFHLTNLYWAPRHCQEWTEQKLMLLSEHLYFRAENNALGLWLFIGFVLMKLTLYLGGKGRKGLSFSWGMRCLYLPKSHLRSQMQLLLEVNGHDKKAVSTLWACGEVPLIWCSPVLL